jgi:hypothetical protein
MTDNQSLFKILRLLKFFRLIRLVKIFKLKKLTGKFNELLLDYPLLELVVFLTKIFLIVSILAHWLSCGFNLILLI